MRRIIVTGGTRGIGAAVTEELRSRGDRVVTIARSGADINMDVGDHIAWIHARNQVIASGVDGLVTCAGIYGPIGLLESAPSSRILECVHTNLLGTMFALHTCLRSLKNRHGRAVLLAGGGRTSLPRYDCYKASKAGVIELMRNLAAEGDIEINCVAPGFVATGIHSETLAAGKSAAGGMYTTTRDRLLQGARPMAEVVRLICYLLSDEAGVPTGRVMS